MGIIVKKNVDGIEGLCVIEPEIYGDERGYFMEAFNEKDLHRNGLDYHFVQDNQSRSRKGVLRGLHFQINHPQCKLVRVIQGRVYDVAVDIRKDSKTYGRWFGIELSADNKKQLLLPENFAHGFLVLSEYAEFLYKVNDFWHKDDEDGIAWNDPGIGIKWPGISGEYRGTASTEGYYFEDVQLIMADKDQKYECLRMLDRNAK